MNSPSLHNSIRKVCALVAATLILPALASLSFSAQAAEKKKVTGTDKFGPPISRTVVPPGSGDDPKHELVVLAIYRATTTSPDPDINGSELITYDQPDLAGTGTQRGYYVRHYKNGDIDYGTYEGTVKTSFKEDGSWEATTWENTWKTIGGTGKFKNIKGSGTSRGKATAEGSSSDWEGEDEY